MTSQLKYCLQLIFIIIFVVSSSSSSSYVNNSKFPESLAIHPYCPSLLVAFIYCIQCLHRADVGWLVGWCNILTNKREITSGATGVTTPTTSGNLVNKGIPGIAADVHLPSVFNHHPSY